MKRKISILGLAVVGAIVVWYTNARRASVEGDAASAGATALRTPVVNSAEATAPAAGGAERHRAIVVAEVVQKQELSRTRVESQTPHRSEVVATAEMVRAHSGLREPNVANPDSNESRVILQRMIENALTRAQAPDRR